MNDIDFAPSNYAEDKNDYVFESPTMRVWEPLTGNHVKHVEHIFPRFVDKSNSWILEQVRNGEGKYWTPETLSFMRSNVIAKRMLNVILPSIIKAFGGGRIPTVVDATANIGGESIQMALSGVVDKVISYEPNKNSYIMLKNNIELYMLGDIITTINSRFDYKIPEGSLVLLDPPFQSSTNIGNFNMSIEPRNLHFVILDIIRAGAKCVLLNTPKDYVINTKFCRDHSLLAVCYRFGAKNVKVYIIMPADQFRTAYGNKADFASFAIKATGGFREIPDDEESYKLMYGARAIKIE